MTTAFADSNVWIQAWDKHVADRELPVRPFTEVVKITPIGDCFKVLVEFDGICPLQNNWHHLTAKGCRV